ncbi:hypothetical protein C2E23DRAFT_534061 [Lenzites betulinus]|nr:hypothetical protein C2E23DRAFT_534061 [Lenzites betulinus]
MSDLGFNVWGVVAGAISLKLFILEGVREETVMLFSKGMKDGLHTHMDDLYTFCSRIWAIDQRIDDIRFQVIAFRTWRQQVKGWWNGVSRDIDLLHGSVDDLRAELSEISSRARRQLAAAGHTRHLAELLAARIQEHPLGAVTPPSTREDTPTYSDIMANVTSRNSTNTQAHAVHVTISQDDDASLPARSIPTSVSSHTETISVLEADATTHGPRSPFDGSYTRNKQRDYRSMRRDTLRRYSEDLCALSLPQPQWYPHWSSTRNATLRGPARVFSWPPPRYHHGISGRHSAQQVPLGSYALGDNNCAYNYAYDGDDEGDV